MSVLVDGILKYSVFAFKEISEKAINLNEIIDWVYTDLELIILDKAAKFSVDRLPTIMMNETLAYQLFYNIVNNALKFTRPGVTPEISITCLPDDDWYIISITDNGIGFGNEYAESIFENFKRLNSREQYEGNGLGLTLCKKIVERKRGKISAKGEPGVGSQFLINLPKH